MFEGKRGWNIGELRLDLDEGLLAKIYFYTFFFLCRFQTALDKEEDLLLIPGCTITFRR